MSIGALAMLPLALAFAATTSAAADSPTPAEYRQAVQDAYVIVSGSSPNDTIAAQSALTRLEAGTGQTQPEVIADLKRTPPDLADAKDRLRSLLDALSEPAVTTNPAEAQARLHDVMSMRRYDALHQPPSLLDRLSQWVNDRIADFLRLLFGGGGRGTAVPDLFFYIVGTVVVAAVAVVVFRSARGRFAQSVSEGQPVGPRAPSDYFAEADRLAAAGDRVAAIRALCAGVAATLAGERTWEGSPLTVREIFRRAPEPDRLRPLLLPFEAAVYGRRDVDAATYARAVEAAAPFRPQQEAAA